MKWILLSSEAFCSGEGMYVSCLERTLDRACDRICDSTLTELNNSVGVTEQKPHIEGQMSNLLFGMA